MYTIYEWLKGSALDQRAQIQLPVLQFTNLTSYLTCFSSMQIEIATPTSCKSCERLNEVIDIIIIKPLIYCL